MKNQDKIIRAMAEYIYENDTDMCECCDYKKQCNDYLREAEEKGKTVCITKISCIDGVILYFKKKAAKENKND